MPVWISELIVISPWVAAIIVVAIAVYKLWPFFRKLGHFVDDVAGEPARAGIEARPGLMERMQGFEVMQERIQNKLDTVHHELFPNSGKSLRDQTNRIEKLLDSDNERISKIEKELESFRELSSTTTGILKTVNSIEQHVKE